MADRRKILIPLGAEPETPHFDAEETLLSARPVVPIMPGEVREDFHYAPARPRPPFYKRPAFLTLIVMAAVGMGLAAGLGIARYRYQAAPAVAQPARPATPPATTTAPDTRTATVQTPEDNQQEVAPALPEVKAEEKTTAGDAIGEEHDKTDEAETPAKAPAKAPERSTEKSSGDDEDNAKTATPDKKRTNDEDEDADNAPRAQRRERRVRNRDGETVDIPRRIGRAGEQINRIREIFEGRQRP
jgi:hypothetical protein